MNLLERMLKTGAKNNAATILKDSPFFQDREIISTDIPIINTAFSGDIYGGFGCGLTVLAGDSKTFKSLLSLVCLKAHQDKYPNSVCIFYDNEFGVTPQYLEANGVNSNRVIHVPIEHIEELKFDMVKKLKDIGKDDNLMIIVDSIGMLASKKEVEDAEDEKSVTDMTRAKSIRSMLRSITPLLTIKNIPCIMINHVYEEMGLYPLTVIPGGKAVTFAANTIFVISKSQEKDGTQVTGFKFTLNINKSRFVKEKSKFPFTVDMSNGIDPFSSLLELSLESGHVISPTQGWYALPSNPEEKFRRKNLDGKFWSNVVADDSFNEWVKNRYQYGGNINSVEEE